MATLATPAVSSDIPKLSAPWPCYGEEEISAVVDVLRSGRVNYWTGDICRKFEREYADYFGSGHAVALCNGTVALELALLSVGIGTGDEVIVTPRTFIASASSIVACGAKPVFCDVDSESGNITAESIAEAITPRTRAVIAVHLAGWPCEMDAICSLTRLHNLYVIEDCAQSHGAMYNGKYAGTFGDVAAWSFCQDKIMTTGGEGGMLTTNDREVWMNAWGHKDHGKNYDTVYRKEHAPGFRWLHEDFGTNWRMTEIQAAIGRLQLGYLPEWLDIRTRNAHILAERLAAVAGLRVPVPEPHIKHAYYKFYAYIVPEKLRDGWDRNRIMTECNSRGITCFSGICGEVYLENAFKKHGLCPSGRLKTAQMLGDTSLMFQVHPTLTIEDMHKTADVVEAVMTEATGA